MHLVKKWIDFVEKMNRWVGESVSLLTGILVLLFVYDVFMRYLFNHTKVWIGELEWHLFALIFLLAGGYTLQKERHVRVDVFYSRLTVRQKAWIDAVGTFLFLIPWVVVVIYTSFHYAKTSFLQGEGSPNPGGLPFRYLIKFSITLGFGFLLLQGLVLLVKALFRILSSDSKAVN